MKTGKYVYKDKNSEVKMHEFYDKAIKSLNVNYKDEYISTSYGKTHILIVGDENKKPVFTIHGGNGISPLNIRLFLPLLNEYCIIAPDVIGMPGKSESFRNLNTGEDFGNWVNEILDKINIDKISFIVSSYSASMLLSLAQFKPEKIDKSVLIVPSGIAHGKIMPMITKMMLPFMKYYFKPTEEGLKGIVEVMCGTCDKLWCEFFDLMMSSYKMEMRAPKEFNKNELKNFTSDVLIFASNYDIFFPADKVFEKSEMIFQGTCDRHLINSKHLPDDETMKDVCDKIVEFLND